MSLITPAVYREHNAGTSLGDDALQRLIDANETRMIRILGPHYDPGVPVVEEIAVHWKRTIINLKQAASEILAVQSRPGGSYDWTVLVPDDYYLSESGLLLHRVGSGSTGGSSWTGVNEVAYIPRFNLEERIGVLLRMTGVDETRGPSTSGVTARTMGSWSEQYGSVSGTAPDPEKDEMLASLLPMGGMTIR
jgi:hypothetical protein